MTGTATVIAPIARAAPVVDGDSEGRHAFLGLLHVERETRPSRACQFAAKGGELFRCQALIRRLAVVAGLAFRQQIQLLERLVGQLGQQNAPT